MRKLVLMKRPFFASCPEEYVLTAIFIRHSYRKKEIARIMLTFDRKFFLFALVLFIVEVLIALFVRDSLVRPYGGDYLVVILIYCAVRTFLKAPVVKVAICVLLFSYLVEVLQYFQLVNRLGLENNIVAKTVIGYGFEWLDLVAYTLGILTVLAFERKNLNDSRKVYTM